MKRIFALTAIIFLLGAILASCQNSAAQKANTRDPWLQPFSTSSIWNTPIGSSAEYVLAGYFEGGTAHNADPEIMLKLAASDPLRRVYGTVNWTDRCSSKTAPQRTPSSELLQIPFPDDFILDDVTPTSTPNNVASLLMPDGKTIIAIEPLARCQKAGDVFGWVKNDTGNETLTGTGTFGGHWGSGLSGIGGSIRHGELTGSSPINHVLKINVPGDYLHFDAAHPETPVNGVVLEGKGYRFPADRNDAGAPGNYKASAKFKAAKMGALLAIPASVNLASLGLQTLAAKKLAQTLQNYGAYIVDDAGAKVSRASGGEYDYAQFSLSLQREAEGEFREVFGYNFAQDNSATGAGKVWFEDYGKLIKALAIVNNNAPSSLGGGGTPRVNTVLPAFGETDTEVPTNPQNLVVLKRTVSSVQLGWTASTDNNRIMRYDVFNKNQLLGSSYGANTITVKQLPINSPLQLQIQAVDTGLNTSQRSSVLATATRDGYVQDFSQNATGWNLGSNISLEYGALKMNGFAENPLTSIYSGKTWGNNYQWRFSVRSDSQDDNGKFRALFHYTDANNTYILEIGGGAVNTVQLKKRVAGVESVLATLNGHFDINKSDADIVLEVNNGKISVRGNENTLLFVDIADATFTRGNIGFQQIGTQAFIDNIELTIME